MDPTAVASSDPTVTIVLAIIGIIGGTVSGYLKIKDTIAARGNAAPPSALPASGAHRNQDDQELIDELRADRRELKSDLREVRTELAQVKADYELSQSHRRNDLLRIELLEEGRERDQRQIVDLEAQVRRLKGSQ